MWEKEKYWLPAFSSFPTLFSESLFLLVIKTWFCLLTVNWFKSILADTKTERLLIGCLTKLFSQSERVSPSFQCRKSLRNREYNVHTCTLLSLSESEKKKKQTTGNIRERRRKTKCIEMTMPSSGKREF